MRFVKRRWLQRAWTGWPRPWGWLLLFCVLSISAAEAVLLGLGTGFFSGGYNSIHARGVFDLAVYTIGSVVLDTALVLALWALLLPLLRWRSTSRLQAYCASILLAVGLPVSMAAAQYQIHDVLGKLIRVSLLEVGSAGSSINAASVVSDAMPSTGLVWTLIVLALALVLLLIARWLDTRIGTPPGSDAPTRRNLLPALTAAAAASLLIVLATRAAVPQVGTALQQKSSAILLTSSIERATDFDGDGFGWLSEPEDESPFDARVHPYALDVPGNGIDENGVGGDHPRDFAPSRPIAVAGSAAAVRPQFLLIYLESFRADLIDRRLGDREITPFLNQLARDGARSDRTFVHNPWTLPSRAQLFTGTIPYRPGGETIVDDFHRRGYRVALFSGQDDSYADSFAIMGADRADEFYDARSDVDRRTSRTNASVSLQVSWKTLLERVFAFLDGCDRDEPLFLYVNIVDTHFPYWHEEIDDILGVPPLSRSEIRQSHAERVFEGYANTAANVDRAIRRLVERWRIHYAGRPQAILVTGDHGQSFYENGTLGHGHEFSDAQTRVPLVLWGVGGVWPEPIAPSDIRGLIDRNLFLPRPGLPRARFQPDPRRSFLQYLGSFERPERIALRHADRALMYDLLDNRAAWIDAAGRAEGARPDPAEVAKLIHTWEAWQSVALDAAGP